MFFSWRASVSGSNNKTCLWVWSIWKREFGQCSCCLIDIRTSGWRSTSPIDWWYQFCVTKHLLSWNKLLIYSLCSHHNLHFSEMCPMFSYMFRWFSHIFQVGFWRCCQHADRPPEFLDLPYGKCSHRCGKPMVSFERQSANIVIILDFLHLSLP